MKTILFLSLFITTTAQARVFQVEIADDKVAVMENDIPDVQAWLEAAAEGKYNNCRSRLIKKEVDESIKAGEAIPAGEDAIIKKHFDRPDYKNRSERDLEGRERN